MEEDQASNVYILVVHSDLGDLKAVGCEKVGERKSQALLIESIGFISISQEREPYIYIYEI